MRPPGIEPKSPEPLLNSLLTRTIVDLGIRADHRVKVKESEKKDKYLDLGR